MSHDHLKLEKERFLVGVFVVDGQQCFFDTRNEEELLDDRIHVTSGSSILQTHIIATGPTFYCRFVLNEIKC